MYACSPRWRGDWLSEEDAEKIFIQLSGKIQASPHETHGIGINFGLHVTGGEPFLNYDLLLKVSKIAKKLKIPSTFVETNCFWCTDDKITREKLMQLKDAGLDGILISVNPFILEEVPFERTERAARISTEVFHHNVIVYQELFYHLFNQLHIKNTLSLEEYLQKTPHSLRFVELLPMGRTAYALGYFFKKYTAETFFGISCKEELTREWHIHIDNYGNYMPGYCGGISLGNAMDLNSLLQGIDLTQRPILNAVVTDLKKLYQIGAEKFGYNELRGGYISKCHLCIDIRKHIVQQSDEFEELRPREFYYHIED